MKRSLLLILAAMVCMFMSGCEYALKYWLTYFKHFFIRFMGVARTFFLGVVYIRYKYHAIKKEKEKNAGKNYCHEKFFSIFVLGV